MNTLTTPGLSEIEGDHREFVSRLKRLLSSSDADFPPQFQELLAHTGEHFLKEGNLMRETKFQELFMHESEHQRMLTEMKELNRGIRRGRLSLVRAHVKENLTDWFDKHLAKMDSMLIVHLKQQ
jgi:hemerythrin-like metal-binding protein